MTPDTAEIVRASLLAQMHAAIGMLRDLIELCPDDAWDAPVASWTFNQSVFHALFWGDVYLGRSYEEAVAHPFHVAHPEIFQGYEEIEPRKPTLRYSREQLRLYAEHCRDRATAEINAETAESLAGPSGFDWLDMPRLEAHIYNARHIQHHASQLVLRRRIDASADTPWGKSGWPSR